MALLASDEVEQDLREWAPLSDLFHKLPTKVHSGLFHQDVKLTCVDVLPEFIALGTNVGLVFWYNRRKFDLQRLYCEDTNAPITVVKVISTVDYMVACGNKEGNISIFQIPKSHPESLPDSLKPKNKQVERYTVSDLHKAPVSAIEWSKNGMKLFSGDKNGLVVLTEIDFYMHLCKSLEILNETYEVVQLSYYQQNLLISTTYRSIICKKLNKWKVSQVGKKDRKILGKFGGMFYQNSLRPADTLVLCTRPGLRIWIADMEGSVQKTLLFKDLLNSQCAEIPLINPISNNVKKLKPQMEATFGVLLPFNDSLLVSFNNDIVYVLDPKGMSVLHVISNLRNVLGVATYKDEIFILEGERSLLRISYRPEPSLETFHSIPTATNFLPISASIRDLTSKLQNTNIISAIPPLLDGAINFSIHTDITSIINAEEATESPKKSKGADHCLESLPNSNNKFDVYDKIGKQEFDDAILYKQQKMHKKHNRMNLSCSSTSSNSSEGKDVNVAYPTLMNLSTVGILPDLRSPNSILSDIQKKEKMLADILNFDNMKVCNNSKIILDESKENASINSNINVCKMEQTEGDAFLQNVDQEFYIKPLRNTDQSSDFLKIPYGPSSGSSCQNSLSEMPACVNIPNDWKLAEIQLNKENNESPDISLAEWEII